MHLKLVKVIQFGCYGPLSLQSLSHTQGLQISKDTLQSTRLANNLYQTLSEVSCYQLVQHLTVISSVPG